MIEQQQLPLTPKIEGPRVKVRTPSNLLFRWVVEPQGGMSDAELEEREQRAAFMEQFNGQ